MEIGWGGLHFKTNTFFFFFFAAVRPARNTFFWKNGNVTIESSFSSRICDEQGYNFILVESVTILATCYQNFWTIPKHVHISTNNRLIDFARLQTLSLKMGKFYFGVSRTVAFIFCHSALWYLQPKSGLTFTAFAQPQSISHFSPTRPQWELLKRDSNSKSLISHGAKVNPTGLL